MLRAYRQNLLAVFLVAFCCLSAQAYTIAEIAKIDSVLLVLRERLRIAEEVARAKWNSGAAIEDLERETQVLERFIQEAAASGIDASLASTVMRAQIEASKTRQRELFQGWKSRRQGLFIDPPDLSKDIRPRLDQLSIRLIRSLRDVQTGAPISSELLLWRARILWGEPLSPAELVSLSFL